MLSLASLAGCALPAAQNRALDEITFLSLATSARGDRREALWRANRDSDGSDDAELRAALLQSLPGHSGYDPAAARRRLGTLADHGVDREVVEFARLRLAELRADEDARNELTTLREQRARLIEIEHRLRQPENVP